MLLHVKTLLLVFDHYYRHFISLKQACKKNILLGYHLLSIVNMLNTVGLQCNWSHQFYGAGIIYLFARSNPFTADSNLNIICQAQ